MPPCRALRAPGRQRSSERTAGQRLEELLASHSNRPQHSGLDGRDSTKVMGFTSCSPACLFSALPEVSDHP